MISASATASRIRARPIKAASPALASDVSRFGVPITALDAPNTGTFPPFDSALVRERFARPLHPNSIATALGGLTMSRNLLAGLALVAPLAAGCAAPAVAADPAKLNDLEIAHAAYVAGDIDVRNAHLALALSDDPRVREFAELMIRDHEAVNEAAVGLLKKLKVEPQDNAFSQALLTGARDTWAKLAKLSGAEFDKGYAANELSYHQTVNQVVGEAFIPNVENGELKSLLDSALDTFKAHEKHAAQVVADIGS